MTTELPLWEAAAATRVMEREGRVFDICSGRHQGNHESRAAFQGHALHRARQRARVLESIRAAGASGLTCRELSKAWGCMMNQVSGRFSELKALGLVRKVGVRDGSGVCIYEPNEESCVWEENV
jgi:hypothetical protein